MFGKWFRRSSPGLPSPAANPGIGPTAKITFAQSDRSWEESVDAVESAAGVFTALGHEVEAGEGRIRYLSSGFVFRPQMVAVQPLGDGSVRTVTTIEAAHPDLVPDGVFEFQHATGGDTNESIRKGFEVWVQTDLVAFLEALRPTPESCTTLCMEFPQTNGEPPRARRAVLGPVAHFMQAPPTESETSDGEEHPFCPCCLLTRSFEAFKDIFQSDRFYAIRFFAARDESGRPEADCRVNGADWKPGAKALRAYARTWPQAGYEFRKQYVILHNAPSPGGLSA